MLYLDNGINIKDIYWYIKRKLIRDPIYVPSTDDISVSAKEIDDAKLKWFRYELRHNAEQLRMKKVLHNWLLYKD